MNGNKRVLRLANLYTFEDGAHTSLSYRSGYAGNVFDRGGLSPTLTTSWSYGLPLVVERITNDNTHHSSKQG